MLPFLKNFRFYGILYLVNRVVSRIPSHALRKWVYRRCMRFKIGAGSFIFMDARFETMGEFEIGSNSTINTKCYLDNRGGIFIGDNVSISSEVIIITADHDLQSVDFQGRTRAVYIEEHVFIGTRAIILAGVRVGRGSAVAAGAVVSRDVPPHSIVAGIPARIINKRREDLHYDASYGPLFN